MRGDVERMLRGFSYTDLWEQIQGRQKVYGPSPTDISLPGDYQRSPMDVIMALLGVKSTGEAAANTTMQIDERKQRLINTRVENLAQQIKENPNSDRSADIYQQLLTMYQQDPKATLQAMDDYQKARLMPETQRRIIDFNDKSITSDAAMLRWLDENRKAPK